MRRRTCVLIVVLGVVLTLPSLRGGFMLDDYYYRQAAQGILDSRPAGHNLYSFYWGDEAVTRRWADIGYAPWWIDESLRMVFLRPLPGALFRLDLRLFEGAAIWYHAHSLLWWGLCLSLACLLLRRVLPGRAALLAGLLLAVDKSHIFPTIWIANRHALVALAPLLLALWAHVRWREDGWRPGRQLAIALAVLALFGGEVAIAGLSYFAAYELVGATGQPMRRRLGALAPFVVLGLVYVVAYRLLGGGAARTGIYVDPGRDPLKFLARAAAYVPTLLASGIGGISADFWFLNAASRPVLIGVGIASTLVLLAVLRWCRPLMDDATRRPIRWLLAGAVLSLVPSATVIPSDRMVLVAAIGFCGVLGVVLDTAWRAWRQRAAVSLGLRRIHVAAGGCVALVHLAAPVATGLYLQRVVTDQDRDVVDLARSPLVQSVRDRQAFVVNAPDHVVGLYLPLVIVDEYGYVPGAAWRPLAMAPCDLVLRRPESRTLELSTTGDGVFLQGTFESLYRDRDHPLPIGTRITRGLLEAEVLDADDQGPTRIAFRFDRDLEDPSLAFLVWRDGELARAELPEVGGEMSLPRSLGPGGF